MPRHTTCRIYLGRYLGISLELRVGRPIEKQRSRLGHHPRPLRNRLHRKSSILSPSAPPATRSIHLGLTRFRMLTDRLRLILCLIRSTTRVSLRPCSFSLCLWLWTRTRRESASGFGEHWPATSGGEADCDLFLLCFSSRAIAN
jgi:hypothetical protein